MVAEEVRILVVDDEKDYLSDFASLFSKKFNLVTATGGEEALAILQKDPVGIVISDQRMPRMTGSELLAKISRLYPQTVRILLTGYSDIEAVIEAVNKGEIYRYASKDLPLQEIEVVIRQALDKYRLEESNRQLLTAKKRLLRSLATQENLTLFGTFGQQVHQRVETLVMSLFNYVFQMGKKMNEQMVLAEFHRIQGALSRLRDLATFSEKLRQSSVGAQKGGLNAMIQEVAARADAAAQKNNGGGAIRLDLDDHLPPLPVHRYSFMRMMKELVENALLFGPKEGRVVSIRSRYLTEDSEESAVRIEVEDNGQGIEEKEIPKLFAPFYSTFSTQDPPEGTRPPALEEYNLGPYYHFGFGLSIAQWIICLRHNGTIDITSQTGKGTTAIVTIPIN